MERFDSYPSRLSAEVLLESPPRPYIYTLYCSKGCGLPGLRGRYHFHIVPPNYLTPPCPNCGAPGVTAADACSRVRS